MSHDIPRLVDEVSRAVDEVLAASQASSVPTSDASQLLVAAARLYTAISDGAQSGPPSSDLLLSPTEACTVAAAMLRSQALTPFEFAIWYSVSA